MVLTQVQLAILEATLPLLGHLRTISTDLQTHLRGINSNLETIATCQVIKPQPTEVPTLPILLIINTSNHPLTEPINRLRNHQRTQWTRLAREDQGRQNGLVNTRMRVQSESATYMTLHNRAHTPILSNSQCLQVGQDGKEHFLSSTTMQEESNSILRTREQLQPLQEKMMMTVKTRRRVSSLTIHLTRMSEAFSNTNTTRKVLQPWWFSKIL